jgi:hypothetical protein
MLRARKTPSEAEQFRGLMTFCGSDGKLSNQRGRKSPRNRRGFSRASEARQTLGFARHETALGSRSHFDCARDHRGRAGALDTRRSPVSGSRLAGCESCRGPGPRDRGTRLHPPSGTPAHYSGSKPARIDRMMLWYRNGKKSGCFRRGSIHDGPLPIRGPNFG